MENIFKNCGLMEILKLEKLKKDGLNRL